MSLHFKNTTFMNHASKAFSNKFIQTSDLLGLAKSTLGMPLLVLMIPQIIPKIETSPSQYFTNKLRCIANLTTRGWYRLNQS
jgi:hypothetical protein